MNADEYERRLRTAVVEGVEFARWQFIDYDECCGDDIKMSHGGKTQYEAALDAYADWLRLRAVADLGYCLSPMTKCEHGQPGGYYKGRYCEPHQAQQQIAAILAAAGGAE